MATIRIHTTQNVTLEYEVASIGSRIVAMLLDYLVMAAWVGAWFYLLFKVASLDHSSSSGDFNWSSPAGIVAILIFAVILGPPIFYFLLAEIFMNGQSLGKKALDLRVVRLDGTAPRVGDYFLRWLLRLVDFGFGNGLVAVITIALNGKGQRLGDLAAGTTVISVRPRTAPLTQLADLAAAATPVGYQPVFPQAADLSDHDVALLRQLLGRSLQQENFLLLHETALKIKQLLHIQTDLGDEAFLRTILRDHAHMVATQ